MRLGKLLSVGEVAEHEAAAETAAEAEATVPRAGAAEIVSPDAGEPAAAGR